MANKSRTDLRKARHVRLRKSLSGTSERPRLAIYRSLKHISAQVIDDVEGKTLCSASSQEKEVGKGGSVEGAKKVGALIAQRAKDKGVKAVVFDRGGFRYMGRVAELADSARKEGLEF